VDEPRVSHYRLAAHLLLAFVTGALALWFALGVRASRAPLAQTAGAKGALGFLLLVLLQSIYGAFMAGTHAGYYFATFPDLDGRYAPGPFFTSKSVLSDAVSSPPAIHYLHRALGFLLLAYAFALASWVRRTQSRVAVRRAALLVAFAAFVQLNLGALTVLTRVALPWAVLHQAMAYALLASGVLLIHRLAQSDAHASPATR